MKDRDSFRIFFAAQIYGQPFSRKKLFFFFLSLKSQFRSLKNYLYHFPRDTKDKDYIMFHYYIYILIKNLYAHVYKLKATVKKKVIRRC